MRIFKYLYSRMNDPDISFEHHMISFMSVISDIALFLAMLGDIAIGENPVETVTLGILIIAVPMTTTICIRHNRILLGGKLQVAALVFVVMPITFFFGGGPLGGGVFWLAVTYMYAGLILSGEWRIFMVSSLSLITFVEYLIYYINPDIIYSHDQEIFFKDALISAILAGIVIYTMVCYQKMLFRNENKRAEEETKRAEELNRSQNQFFSSMSHEIRTPINSILGLNEIILRQEDASDEIRRDAANIQGSGKMLLALVNDILDVSKIEAGKMEIIPVNYNVGNMISEIVNMVWMRAEDKGLKLQVDIDPSLPSELCGDEVRIKQILINLLNNAVKYTAAGSITLHIECEDKDEDRAKIIYSVIDTGMGIKQDALPYLFDSFKRVDEEKNRHIEGTGLGLSIVKQLVELMDGDISVNSIYTQGSTFTVTLWQSITDKGEIGSLDIASYGSLKSSHKYESGFIAPDARILIVDDNEMNLEVEKKLLIDTQMQIDTVKNGTAALNDTLSYRYDVILMDHLMPEMDGIECLANIRKQRGGLNNHVPVIVLTANAGSDNIEMYRASGFDGYLLKPVSGAQLEEMLLRHIPEEKITRNAGSDISRKEMNTTDGYTRKVPVKITASSTCDLPESLRKELNIEILPFKVYTDRGVFWDNLETNSDELIRYMKGNDRTTKSEPPTVKEFEMFFARQLRSAHHVIHLTITSGMSEEYNNASEAAKVFENVTVINSECLSSSTGLLALCAGQMAARNEPADKIVYEIGRLKKNIHCSFVLAVTDYMQRSGFIGKNVNMFLKALNIRPSLHIKNDIFGVYKIFIGNKRKCYENYIKKALPRNARPDLDVIFVTYVDVPEEDIIWIEEMIKERFDFKHIIFQKASAAISANCGPGTFGLLYMDRGKRLYNLGSLFRDDDIINGTDDEAEEGEMGIADDNTVNLAAENTADIMAAGKTSGSTADIMAAGITSGDQAAEKPDKTTATDSGKWYDELAGIDGETAIKNSGSEDAFLTVLKIFYDSIESKSTEIEGYYESEDWDNYTIKVHALKSSAKLIGALELSSKAQELENAGKEKNIDYIRGNHDSLMEDYKEYLNVLGKLYDNAEDNSEADKPVADSSLMESVYESIRDAAGNFDTDMIEAVFHEMEQYSIPEDEKERYEAVRQKAESFDYEGILALLDE